MILPEQAGTWAKGTDLMSSRVAACRAAHAVGYDLFPNDLALLDLVEQGGGNRIEKEHIGWLADGALEFLNAEAPAGFMFDWVGPDRLELTMERYL